MIKTVGSPLPGVDLRIVDPETGKTLPQGEVGEIRVKGYVTVGYYKDADKNRTAVVDCFRVVDCLRNVFLHVRHYRFSWHLLSIDARHATRFAEHLAGFF